MRLDKYREKTTLNNKKLLILGGSRNDIEFIKAAHEMGIKVGVTDWYSPEKSPAKNYADYSHDISISDIDELSKLIKEYQYDGVLTGFTDSYLEYYVELCERNGLPVYASREQIENLTNKSIYKKIFEKHGVPTLDNYSVEEINKDFNNYPLVIKPVDGSGGKGLEIVRDYQEFKNSLDISMDSSKEGKVVIEPFIEKRKELTAFFLFIDGQVILAGTANRFLSKSQGEKIGLPVLYTMQSSYHKQFEKNVFPQMKEMFEDMEIKNGILFAQCLVHNDDIFVYDLGYRATGTLEYKLFEDLYGVNTLKMLINFALTGDMDLYKLDYSNIFKTNKSAVNITMLGKEGTVGKIEGIDDLKSIEGMIDAAVKTAPGEVISENMIGTLGQIIMRIFLTSESLDETLEKIDKVYSNIKIEDINGENMILDLIDFDQVRKIYGI